MTESQESWTPYHYVYGNPVRLTDPDGRFPDDPVNKIVDQTVGFSVAVLDNFTGINLRGEYTPANAADYNRAQDAGDLGSIFVGADMALGGGAAAKLSLAGAIFTEGVSLVPAAVSTGVAAWGTFGAARGANNLINQKGRVTDQNGRVNASSRPNNGNAPKHGNTNHNDRIDRLTNKLKNDPNNVNIRKNQQQHDYKGNKVGNNRPDVQWDNKKTGKHYNVEYDTKKSTSKKHQQQVPQNDPNAVNKFWMVN